MCGDGGREAEAYQTHANFSQLLMKDNYASHQCPEHALITWIEQPLGTFLHHIGSSATGGGGGGGVVSANAVNTALAAPSTSAGMMAMPGSSIM